MAAPWMAALNTQLDLIRYWRSATPDTHAADDPELGEQVALTIQALPTLLDCASTWWMSAEVTSLISYACQSLPAETVLARDMVPLPAGFVLLEEVRGSEPALPGEADIGAFAWLTLPPRLALVIFARDKRQGMPGGLTPLPMAGTDFGAPLDYPFMRYLASFFLLSQQRITQARSMPLERHLRRRAERAGTNLKLEDGIRVVTLRRPAATVAADAVGGVEWSHRWVVDGHWRQQWYPSTEDHRPVWIAPYIKGPEEAPLVVKDRVYRFVR